MPLFSPQILVYPKPISCLLNYGKWMETGVHFYRSNSLTEVLLPLGRVSIQHIGVIFSIPPKLSDFLSLAWTSTFHLNSFFYLEHLYCICNTGTEIKTTWLKEKKMWVGVGPGTEYYGRAMNLTQVPKQMDIDTEAYCKVKVR